MNIHIFSYTVQFNYHNVKCECIFYASLVKLFVMHIACFVLLEKCISRAHILKCPATNKPFPPSIGKKMCVSLIVCIVFRARLYILYDRTAYRARLYH